MMMMMMKVEEDKMQLLLTYLLEQSNELTWFEMKSKST